MPYAQNHYPFENCKEFEENFPADFVAEGSRKFHNQLPELKKKIEQMSHEDFERSFYVERIFSSTFGIPQAITAT